MAEALDVSNLSFEDPPGPVWPLKGEPIFMRGYAHRHMHACNKLMHGMHNEFEVRILLWQIVIA